MYTGLGDRVDNLNEELFRTKEIMGLLNEQSKGKLKFNKQPKKKGAKTDVYNVVKGGTTIRQVKWYSRLRGYGFVPPSGDESEVTEFVKEISKTHREKNKKNKKK